MRARNLKSRFASLFYRSVFLLLHSACAHAETTIALTTTVHANASASEKQLTANLLALLEVETSLHPAIQVVERQQLDLAMHELILSNSIGKNASLQLGKLATADLILTAQLLENGKQHVLVRIVEALTGAIRGATVAPIDEVTIEEASEQIVRYLAAVVETPELAGVSVSIAPFESLGRFDRLRPLELGLRDLITVQLLHYGRFQVLQRSDMAQLLIELDLIRSGLADQSRLPETLPSRAAAYHLRGTVEENNQGADLFVVVHAKLIHADSGRVVYSMQFEAMREDIPKALARETDRLMAQLTKETKKKVTVEGIGPDSDATQYLFDLAMQDVYRFRRHFADDAGHIPFRIPKYRVKSRRPDIHVDTSLRDHLLRKSIDRLESVLFVKPDRMDVAFALAFCHSFHRNEIWNPQRVEHLLKQVIGHEPKSQLGTLAFRLLAEMYFHQDGVFRIEQAHEEPAIRNLLFILSRKPHTHAMTGGDQGHVLECLGHLYLKRGDFELMAHALAMAAEHAEQQGAKAQSMASFISRSAVEFIRKTKGWPKLQLEVRQLLVRWSESDLQRLVSHGASGLARVAESERKYAEAAKWYQHGALAFTDITDPKQNASRTQFLTNAARSLRRADNPQAALDLLNSFKPVHQISNFEYGSYGTELSACLEALGRNTEALETLIRFTEKSRGLAYTYGIIEKIDELGGVALREDRDIDVTYVDQGKQTMYCWSLATDSKRLYCGGGTEIDPNENRRKPRLGVDVLDLETRSWSHLGGPEDRVSCLACEGNLLWVGTNSAGLWRCNLKSGIWKQWTTGDGLPTNTVVEVVAHKNSAFAGVGETAASQVVSGGVVRINPSDQVHVLDGKFAPGTAPRCLAVYENRLYAISRWQLSEYDLDSEKWLEHQPAVRAWSVFPGTSSLWLSAPPREILKYGATEKENEFYHQSWYPKQSYKAGYKIKFLIEQDGQLWFGGEPWLRFKSSGFYRLDLKTGEFKNYGPRDGFRYKMGNEFDCSDGLWAAGRLWLATSFGLAEITMRDPNTAPQHSSPTRRTASADERTHVVVPRKRNRNRPVTTSETTKQESLVDFFPRIPYPGIGMNQEAGHGFHFLCIAGCPEAARDLEISQEQQKAIMALFAEYWEKYGPIEIQWLKARDKARKLLNEKQNQRIEQVLVLREGFRAFLRKDIQQKIQLSEQQVTSINTLIQTHRHRRGRNSLRRLGTDIQRLLSPEQRSRFDEIRGLPASQLSEDKPTAKEKHPKPKEITIPEAGKLISVDQLDEKGFSQLHRAASAGDIDSAEALLAQGANVDIPQRKFHGTPLQYAASTGKVEMVQWLLQHKATVDSTDTNGRTPLLWAASQGHPEVARVLLQAGAKINKTNRGGWTALHYAADKDHLEVAQLLIESGASLSAKNTQGKTPLDLNLNIAPPE